MSRPFPTVPAADGRSAGDAEARIMAHETSFSSPSMSTQRQSMSRMEGQRTEGRNGRGLPQNVGATERVVSAMAGAGLALWGLRRGGITGVVGLAAGATLAARGVSGYCPWYAANAAGSTNDRRTAEREGWSRASAVTRSVTIRRPKDEVYREWRNFKNLQNFMQHVERIDVLSPERSHWVVKAPAGMTVEWDAIVTEDRPNELIAWKSAEGADVRNTGRVEFREAPGGGTEVRAVLAYEPPGGAIGEALARLLGEEPSIQAHDDLHRFKSMLENGAGRGTAGSSGSSHGSSSQTQGATGGSTVGSAGQKPGSPIGTGGTPVR
jgi:uncharacterized membrane protein